MVEGIALLRSMRGWHTVPTKARPTGVQYLRPASKPDAEGNSEGPGRIVPWYLRRGRSACSHGAEAALRYGPRGPEDFIPWKPQPRLPPRRRQRPRSRTFAACSCNSGPAGLGQRIADILAAFYTDDTPTAASQPLDLADEHLALALIDSSKASAAEPFARFAMQIARRELASDARPEVRRRRARRALRVARRELAAGALASCAETNVLDDMPHGRLTVSGDVYLINLLAEAASCRNMTIEENVRLETAVPA